ncbi:MAG: hypothetical protein ACE5J7_02650 [Candidatus Aenigmatarchaeota archaeon]
MVSEAKVRRAHNFKELYSSIREAGEIKGARKSYKPVEIIGIIDKTRKGKLDTSYVTRTAGLRSKVESLIKEEHTRKIRGARNLDDLYSVLDDIGKIKGRAKDPKTGKEPEFSANYLKKQIGEVKKGKHISYVTSSDGLRDKVAELVSDFREELKEEGYSRQGIFMLKGFPERKEGIKLHVSSNLEHSRAVREIVLPILQKYDVTHKIVKSGVGLRDVMGAKESQKGKFITVYPESDKEAVKIAREIDSALAGKKLHGPKIANENKLPGGKSGLVFYRYGAFKGEYVTGPKGEKIKDDKIRYGILPPVPKGFNDPFKEKKK